MTTFQISVPAALFKNLGNASECEIKWFTYNYMIVNSGKFQSIIIERSKGKIDPQSLTPLIPIQEEERKLP